MVDIVMRAVVALEPAAMPGPQPASHEPMPAESEAAETIRRAIARVEAPPSGLAPPTENEVALPTKMDTLEHRGAPPANVSALPGQHPEVGETTGQTMTSPFIQRQPEAAPAPDVAEPGRLDAGEVAEGEESAGEIDVDELARRVYSNIKQRLVVEWERVRGRF
jgi:hypothetical protein